MSVKYVHKSYFQTIQFRVLWSMILFFSILLYYQLNYQLIDELDATFYYLQLNGYKIQQEKVQTQINLYQIEIDYLQSQYSEIISNNERVKNDLNKIEIKQQDFQKSIDRIYNDTTIMILKELYQLKEPHYLEQDYTMEQLDNDLKKDPQYRKEWMVFPIEQYHSIINQLTDQLGRDRQTYDYYIKDIEDIKKSIIIYQEENQIIKNEQEELLQILKTTIPQLREIAKKNQEILNKNYKHFKIIPHQ